MQWVYNNDFPTLAEGKSQVPYCDLCPFGLENTASCYAGAFPSCDYFVGEEPVYWVLEESTQ